MSATYDMTCSNLFYFSYRGVPNIYLSTYDDIYNCTIHTDSIKVCCFTCVDSVCQLPNPSPLHHIKPWTCIPVFIFYSWVVKKIFLTFHTHRTYSIASQLRDIRSDTFHLSVIICHCHTLTKVKNDPFSSSVLIHAALHLRAGNPRFSPVFRLTDNRRTVALLLRVGNPRFILVFHLTVNRRTVLCIVFFLFTTRYASHRWLWAQLASTLTELTVRIIERPRFSRGFDLARAFRSYGMFVTRSKSTCSFSLSKNESIPR